MGCAMKYQWPTPSGLCQANIQEQDVPAVITWKKIRIVHLRTRRYKTEIWERVRVLKDGGWKYANCTIPITGNTLENMTFNARVILPNGTTMEIAPKGLQVQEVNTKNGKQKVISAPVMEAGAEIEYHLLYREYNYALVAAVSLQEEMPIVEATVDFEAPDSVEHAFVLPGSVNCPKREFFTKLGTKMARYSFSFGTIPPYQPSPLLGPIDRKPLEMLFIPYTDGDLKMESTTHRKPFNPFVPLHAMPVFIETDQSINAQAKALVVGTKTRSDSLEACFSFVQNTIRNTDKSNPSHTKPSMILKSGLANPTGKRSLLRALLAALGYTTGLMGVITDVDFMTLGQHRLFLPPVVWRNLDAETWDQQKQSMQSLPEAIQPWLDLPKLEYAVFVVDHNNFPCSGIPVQAYYRVTCVGLPDSLFTIREIMVPERLGYRCGQIPLSFVGSSACGIESMESIMITYMAELMPGSQLGPYGGRGAFRLTSATVFLPDRRSRTQSLSMGPPIRSLQSPVSVDTFNYGYCGTNYSPIEERFTVPNATGAIRNALSSRIMIEGDAFSACRTYRGDIASAIGTQYLGQDENAGKAYLRHMASNWCTYADTSTILSKIVANFTIDHGFAIEMKGSIANGVSQQNGRVTVQLGKMFLQEYRTRLDHDQGGRGFYFGDIRTDSYSIVFKDQKIMSVNPNAQAFANDIGKIELLSKGNELVLNVTHNITRADASQAEAVRQFYGKLNEMAELSIVCSSSI